MELIPCAVLEGYTRLSSSNRINFCKQNTCYKCNQRIPESLYHCGRIDRRNQVSCRQLHDLLSEMTFPPEIHLLQVDAEGADDQVINSCSRDTLRPQIINYESKHLNENRKNRLENFLTENRYRLYNWNAFDTLAIRLPI